MAYFPIHRVGERIRPPGGIFTVDGVILEVGTSLREINIDGLVLEVGTPDYTTFIDGVILEVATT